MKIGINSPVVVQLPGAFSPWEAEAGIDELGAVAETADALGFDFLTCSEHVMVPADIAAQRGGTYWDPLATFGYLAARTTRIRLATQVLVLGYHHPLAIAKRYGTLDRVSGGRLVLGLGVGSLEEEFALLGATFEGRGVIADDALRALRASLSQPRPTYDGEHFAFRDVVVEPHAVQPKVPLWIGGRTPRSLRRAVELADGWVPFGLSPTELATLLGRVDLPAGFEVVLSPERALDPTREPGATADALGVLAEAGATSASVRVAADSAQHYREQLAALAAHLPAAE
ncbi:LLM class F420-dependent oxidoreductase [Pimelobacter simplex]|uniref:LLM class F420-dependent oxidoreductase n=1 Tax=Nocardioides simplex TaxID=2045 RepID=UPI0011419244|nr:LLM class F420-dependent oxidoreductase [Pimelobacter simplex]GEB12496.1 LLM class F420-dependent oxidoreductase [Pimelobacter simplex]